MTANRIGRLLLALALLGLTGTAGARTVVAEGTAAIDGNDVVVARDRAIANALREASLTADGGGVRVAGAATDTRLHTRANARLEKVINESADGGLYRVRVLARVGGRAPCGGDRPRLRKRVVAAAFQFLHPEHIHAGDSYGYRRGLPAELLRALAGSGRFLTGDATDYDLFSRVRNAPEVAKGPYGRDLVREVGERWEADVVIGGVIRDLGIERGGPSFIPAALREPTRRVEVEFFLFDGRSGALLARHRHAREATGDVVPGASVPFGSHRFYRTDLGRLFREILEVERSRIERDLACLPFATRVAAVRDGRIILRAGSRARLQPGDTLDAYRAATLPPGDAGRAAPARLDRKVGEVVVEEVSFDYAVARAADGSPDLAMRLGTGDIVRSR